MGNYIIFICKLVEISVICVDLEVVIFLYNDKNWDKCWIINFLDNINCLFVYMKFILGIYEECCINYLLKINRVFKEWMIG